MIATSIDETGEIEGPIKVRMARFVARRRFGPNMVDSERVRTSWEVLWEVP